jgi:hypothetical protein
MEIKGKRGKKPLDYVHFLEAEAVYLTGKSEEKVKTFKALSELEKKKVLAQIKSKLKKKENSTTTKKATPGIIFTALDGLLNSIKKEGSTLTEKELVKLYSKVDAIKEKIEKAKVIAAQKEQLAVKIKKEKALEAKRLELEALKKEIEALESK